ncbi:hypothetical protein DFH09DRAFT_1137659 [Mycena vulgaris]|nr:hypothetical protein DFH09DRAFT_1137659 [Mycena vulgaris]
MDICHLHLSRSLIAAHTSLHSWPLENALRAFIGQPYIAHTHIATKHTWPWPMYPELKPTLTSLYAPGPTPRLVATACSVALIGSLVSLALFLFVWRSATSLPKPERAALSENAILRIHKMASRQPYPMPPDDGGDGATFPALPFARNPRKQSLFIFLLFLLLVAGTAAYFLSPFWLGAVSRHVSEQHNKVSWALTVVLSTILVNISDRFLQFAFFLVPPIRSIIQASIWMVVTVLFKPAATAHSAHLQSARIAHYLSHRCFGIPLNRPLPARVDRSTTLVSSAVSAVGGYRLVSSRVARNYMLILKAMVQEPLELVQIYSSVKDARLFPTNIFQSWAWWATKHLLTFILGELSWRSISRPKLFVLLAPTLSICSYGIYKYNQVTVPPRSYLQLSLDPIHHELQRQAVEQADMKRILHVEQTDMKRILQRLDQLFANLDQGSLPNPHEPSI